MIYTFFMKSARPKFNFSSLNFRFPLLVGFACIILSVVVGMVGYGVFKQLFEEQYKTITEQFAKTANSYIDGDSIIRYVEEMKKLSKPSEAQYFVTDEEWLETNKQLDDLTISAQLAYIYVCVLDANFENRVYIYDTVHPAVMQENPKIKPYPLGKVSSLKSYDEERINELKRVMNEGATTIHFVYNKNGGHVTTNVPIRNSKNEIVAVMSIVKPMSEVKSFKQRYIQKTANISAGLTVLFLILFIFFQIKMLIKPVVIITKETSGFANNKGELTEAIKKIKGKDELGTLARSIEKMVVDIHNYVDQITKATAEKERISAELNVATEIQANMLPRYFPPYANHPELELFASMKPAKEVGGDLYDFFFIDEDRFAVLVGDVSGKGVPAALFMVIAKTLLKNVGLSTPDPAKIMEQVNNQLCEGNDAGLFVTCWLGIITLSTGKMVFANAGHNAPVFYHKGQVEYLTTKPDLMLGVFPGMKYDNHECKLERGDRIFIYTDGVTEAMNSNNELYGEDRLISAISGDQSRSSKAILEDIERDLNRFVDGAPQFDDITMLELSLKKVGE